MGEGKKQIIGKCYDDMHYKRCFMPIVDVDCFMMKYFFHLHLIIIVLLNLDNVFSQEFVLLNITLFMG